jgi:hypothetical protein
MKNPILLFVLLFSFFCSIFCYFYHMFLLNYCPFHRSFVFLLTFSFISFNPIHENMMMDVFFIANRVLTLLFVIIIFQLNRFKKAIVMALFLSSTLGCRV